MTIVVSAVVERPLVALTFDDGPVTAVTGPLLDVLSEYGARATFFVRGAALITPGGDLVTDAVGLLRRIADEGHEVGNHTQNHLLLSRYSRRTVEEEIDTAHSLLVNVLGASPTLIRPPFAADADRVDSIASRRGYQATVLWSTDGTDWHNETSASQIVGAVCDNPNLSPGTIVLLHERTQTIEPLQKIIPELQTRGYELVTVSTLLTAASSTVAASLITRAGWLLRRNQRRLIIGRRRHSDRNALAGTEPCSFSGSPQAPYP
jgi:peptidoglycan/xylan/chitin deacetylase (PgdA/CDA1 family)